MWDDFALLAQPLQTKTIMTLLLIFLSLFSPTLKDIPVLHEGRFCPYAATTTEGSLDDPKCIAMPTKAEQGQWVPLALLPDYPTNISLYSDQAYNAIRTAYLEKDAPKVAQELLAAYQTIAGRVYSEGAKTKLRYPHLWQLRLERFYRIVPLTLTAAFFYALFLVFYQRRSLLYTAFACHTLLLVTRMLILKRPFVSNMQETYLFVPWVAIGLSLALSKQYKTLWLPWCASLFAAALLVVGRHAPLSNVPAVLNSNFWLTIHVLMVVGSYGAFILAGLLGHIALITHACLKRALLQMLYIGTALLISGTILGGIWAAQSWGRFWDWDPKESWAFISAGIYVILLHLYHFKKVGRHGLAIGSIIGLMAITFTWYGVNTILATGLHSYGFEGGAHALYLGYFGFEFLFLTFFFARKRILQKKSEKDTSSAFLCSGAKGVINEK